MAEPSNPATLDEWISYAEAARISRPRTDDVLIIGMKSSASEGRPADA